MNWAGLANACLIVLACAVVGGGLGLMCAIAVERRRGDR